MTEVEETHVCGVFAEDIIIPTNAFELRHFLNGRSIAALLRLRNVPKGTSSADAIQFRPVLLTTQVVAGTNYYVKLSVVHANQDPPGPAEEYIHVRIFYQPWAETTKLTGIQVDVQRADGFDYDFEPLPEDAPAGDVGQQEGAQSDQHVLPRTMIR
ncbi:unnamed protein product [Mortierella alpina]